VSGPNAPAAIGQQNFRTPDDMLDACLRRFKLHHFAWDLACSEHDCVGLNGGFEHPRVDALTADWAPLAGRGVCWLNPPFAKAGKFCKRAADAAELGVRTVALVPVALGTRWWRRYVHQRAVVVGVGRVVFDNPDGSPVLGKSGKPQAINRDVAVLAYGLGDAVGADVGDWYLLEDWRTW
jgi:hypothetical protein